MTVKVLVACRDLKSDMYGPPVAEVSEGTAIRAFAEVINSGGDATICKYPQDFELVRLGTFDDRTAVFECSAPRQLALGSDLVVKKN